MRLNITDRYKSFYFIGIGGVSMSGLAKYLLSLGKKVGGSDNAANAYTEELAASGAEISIFPEIKNIENYELIVYTDAVSENDVYLNEAKKSDKTIISRGKFLYEISRNFNKTIAVSGCHGKTTCTAMLTNIFHAANKNFTAHMGGNDLNFSNFYSGGNDFFITEACEYRKNFLYLKPDIALILNSDADHLECYGSKEALKQSYIDFASAADVGITLYKDLNLPFGYTFGFDKNADFCAKNIRVSNGIQHFTLCEGGAETIEIGLNALGKHNVLNAVAAAAAARCSGIGYDKIKEGLFAFKGVERRFERIGMYNGADAIADYAHHPNELKAVIRTAQKLTEGRLYIIFQPHTYSRTKLLFNEFVRVLSQQSNVMVYKTFAAREYFDDAGSAYTLSLALKKARYGEGIQDVKNFLSGCRSGDLILFLGAGDIYFLAKKILDKTV